MSQGEGRSEGPSRGTCLYCCIAYVLLNSPALEHDHKHTTVVASFALIRVAEEAVDGFVPFKTLLESISAIYANREVRVPLLAA